MKRYFCTNFPKLKKHKKGIEIEWNQSKKSSFSYHWLMDHCDLINKKTNQRTFETFSIPFDLQPREIKINEEKKLIITWNGKDKDFFDLKDLENLNVMNDQNVDMRINKENERLKRILWDKSIIEQNGLPSVEYNFALGDVGLIDLVFFYKNSFFF